MCLGLCAILIVITGVVSLGDLLFYLSFFLRLIQETVSAYLIHLQMYRYPSHFVFYGKRMI